MQEAAVFSISNIAAGFLGATLTGPLGGIDLPQADLSAALRAQPTGYAASLLYADGSAAGRTISGNIPADYSQYPDVFLHAVMAIEDKRFTEHGGVDPLATASAVLSVLMGDPRGGSTISQQTIKNIIIGGDVSLDRKIAEAILSVRAHLDMSHDEMMAAYLNTAWFGRGVTGAGRAPQAWFGKDWDEVTLAEAALLAAMLKGASHYDPARSPERAIARRNLVLDQMEQLGWITPEDAAEARAEQINLAPAPPQEEGDLWAARATNAEVRSLELDPSVRAQSGMSLELTIDAQWQDIAARALYRGVSTLAPGTPAGRLSEPLLRRLTSGDASNTDLRAVQTEGARRISAGALVRRVSLVSPADGGDWNAISDNGATLPEWVIVEAANMPSGYAPRAGDILVGRPQDEGLVLELMPGVQGAVVVMDPRTGAILASIGGHDPMLSAFDRTRALRQPGSAIKPFLWLAALNLGYPHDTPVLNVERDFIDANGEVWRPQNYDRSQTGVIPMFVGLERSSNLAAVNIADAIGIEAMASMAEYFGAYPQGGMYRSLASSLGASEVRLRDFTAAYSGLINGGNPVQPYLVQRAVLGGQSLWEREQQSSRQTLLSQQNIQTVQSMLRGVVTRGTAFSAFQGHPVTVIGKTGTSQLHRDAWFIGVTPGVAVGVWIGRDDNLPIPGGQTGGTSAAIISADILREAFEAGLVTANGTRGGQLPPTNWPPTLLQDRGGNLWVADLDANMMEQGFGGTQMGSSLDPDRGDFMSAPQEQGEFAVRSLF